MFGLILGAVLVASAFAVRAVLTAQELKPVRGIIVSVLGVLGVVFMGAGAVGYNDAGFCQHTRNS